MNTSQLLHGKRALVFGAGGTVGAAVAREFAAEGAEVFCSGRVQAVVIATRPADTLRRKRRRDLAISFFRTHIVNRAWRDYSGYDSIAFVAVEPGEKDFSPRRIELFQNDKKVQIVSFRCAHPQLQAHAANQFSRLLELARENCFSVPAN